jgi:hypothetical protein
MAKPDPASPAQMLQGCLVLLGTLFFLGISVAMCRSDSEKPEAVAPQSAIPFGKGDDAAAWLSRCAPPEQETSTAYDDPRPPIVTRFLDYPSKGVRVILVPIAPADSSPPYEKWRLMGLTDPATDQPIDPKEARRRMGAACR